MLLAALLDAGAPLQAVLDAVEAVLPERVSLESVEVRRAGMRASHLRLQWTGQGGPGAGRYSVPRSFDELYSAVRRSPLAPPVASRSMAVLDRLAAAEAHVHGVDRDGLRLHELGDDDTLVDVVGVVAALEGLEIDRLMVSSIPLTGDTTLPATGSHPEIRLPAPITLELLQGFDIRGAGAGETITPTAAAIFATLGVPARLLPRMSLDAVGYGAGTRDPSEYPNVVRVLLGSQVDGFEEAPARDLAVLEANIDDLTPELVADAAEALRSGGALDVWTTPVQMKKGRSAIILSALCAPADESAISEIFFRATTTFGVRSYGVRRVELERRIVTVPVSGKDVRVKVGLHQGRVMSATPEHDDVAAVAGRAGRAVREVHEEATAAAHALRLMPATGDGS